MGQNYTHSVLRISNNTSTDIIKTSVYGVNNCHWVGNCRPDCNFENVPIPANQFAEKTFALKNSAPHCIFTMTLTFRNGKEDTFRINQKHTVGGSADFHHLQQTHHLSYDRFENRIVITIRKTQNQIQEEKAQEKNKQGKTALQQKKYTEAIKIFDEALSLAKEMTTISMIRQNKGESYNELGEKAFEEGFELEKNDKSQEAQSKFEEAKNRFREAQNLHNSSHIQRNLNIAVFKIEGNQAFNDAIELADEAHELYNMEKSDHTATQNKYQEAQAKFEEALDKYQEGAKIDSKFGESVRVAKDAIEGVKKRKETINQADLVDTIKKVTFDVTEKNNTEIEESFAENLQLLVDG